MLLHVSKSEDKATETLAHHRHIYEEMSKLEYIVDPISGEPLRLVFRAVGDGKDIRVQLSRDTAAGAAMCPRCSQWTWHKWDFFRRVVMDLRLRDAREGRCPALREPGSVGDATSVRVVCLGLARACACC